MESLAQLGVQLLLFGLGLELSISKLRAVGGVAVLGAWGRRREAGACEAGGGGVRGRGGRAVAGGRRGRVGAGGEGGVLLPLPESNKCEVGGGRRRVREGADGAEVWDTLIADAAWPLA